MGFLGRRSTMGFLGRRSMMGFVSACGDYSGPTGIPFSQPKPGKTSPVASAACDGRPSTPVNPWGGATRGRSRRSPVPAPVDPIRLSIWVPPLHISEPRRKQAMDRVGSGEKHLEDCTVSKFVNSPSPMPKLFIPFLIMLHSPPVDLARFRIRPRCPPSVC
jgi:hypothetical protein